MKRKFNEFKSPAGTPHKVPVPTKKQSKCKHKTYGCYAFDMMKVPTCIDCGKSMSGEKAQRHLDIYQKIIDKANEDAQKQYDNYGWGSFYIKNSDGSYRSERREKPKKNIFHRIGDLFA